MPFVLEKSPNVQFNKNSENLLQSIVARLEQQQEHVKSVHVLPNFSVDADTTLKFGKGPIAQGLVVCVTKSYKLNAEDTAWFHPSIARGRSVFALNDPVSKAKLTAIEISGTNSSVGAYSITRPDDFGCEQVEHRLVVDMSEEEMLTPLYNRWVQQGLTAGEVEKQWKRMKFGETYSIIAKTDALRAELARKIAPNCTQISSDTVNAVLSDIENIYFTNNVVRAGADNTVLVKFSALGGYRQYSANKSTQRFYPATLGSSETYYSWDEMNPQNCARIEQSCSWPGLLTFNTQVMTPPSIPTKCLRAVEDEFSMTHQDTLTMRLSAFSSSDSFVDHIAPTDMFKLEPSPDHIRKANNFIMAPVSMDHPVMHKLMHSIKEVQKKHPDFQLFNPKFMSGDRFKIPREVYKLIA
jgi:hypothetical protein